MAGIDRHAYEKAALRERIKNEYTFHPPKEGQEERYESLRANAEAFALLIVTLTPMSREQSLALTHLDEATSYAIKAIARNE
jgi:hypothetical protein